MTISLNKTIKTEIVDKAIQAKFKEQYEKALRAFEVAARDHVVVNSQHAQFNSLGLPPEMMEHVNKISCIYLRSDIVSNIGFIGDVSLVRFDSVVYAHSGGIYLRDNDIKELSDLRKLVKKIEAERDNLHTVIMSYRNAKKLVADLPWTEQYLPTEAVSTGLIAVDVLNDINAKFGK